MIVRRRVIKKRKKKREVYGDKGKSNDAIDVRKEGGNGKK